MTIYNVIRKADGRHVHRYDAPAPVQWQGMEFATHDHTVEPVAPTRPEPPALPADRRITKLAFRNRFTQAEKIAIEIAQLDDKNSSAQARQGSAALRASQADVLAAQFIDLNRADTRAGVQYLEQVGILGAGRAAVILDGAIAETEKWRG